MGLTGLFSQTDDHLSLVVIQTSNLFPSVCIYFGVCYITHMHNAATVLYCFPFSIHLSCSWWRRIPSELRSQLWDYSWCMLCSVLHGALKANLRKVCWLQWLCLLSYPDLTWPNNLNLQDLLYSISEFSLNLSWTTAANKSSALCFSSHCSLCQCADTHSMIIVSSICQLSFIF
jgi:hypothetical protein